VVNSRGIVPVQTEVAATDPTSTPNLSQLVITGTLTDIFEQVELAKTPTPTDSPTTTITPTPTPTESTFEIGQELAIEYLQKLEITGSEITFEEKLADRSNYHQHLVSYISEGNKIYGLLTIPFG
jgi:hypothetical protein